MPHEPVDFRADLARRLRCAEGHLRGIAAMIERGTDCESIVCQTMAVQGALREVNRRLVKHYLDNRLASDLQAPDPALRQHTLENVVALYQLIAYR